MLRQTCLLLPDQAAGDSVAALLRWYGESIDEHLTIRITVRQRRGMNRLGALERHQASIQCWPHAALCRDPQPGVWLLGSKRPCQTAVRETAKRSRRSGAGVVYFLCYNTATWVLLQRSLIFCKLRSPHCIAAWKRLEFQLSSSAFKVSTQSKALMKAQ